MANPSSSSLPNMVCDFPDPVIPYANTLVLYPSIKLSKLLCIINEN